MSYFEDNQDFLIYGPKRKSRFQIEYERKQKEQAKIEEAKDQKRIKKMRIYLINILYYDNR